MEERAFYGNERTFQEERGFEYEKGFGKRKNLRRGARTEEKQRQKGGENDGAAADSRNAVRRRMGGLR